MPTNELKIQFIKSLLDFADRKALKAKAKAEEQQSAASDELPQAEEQLPICSSTSSGMSQDQGI